METLRVQDEPVRGAEAPQIAAALLAAVLHLSVLSACLSGRHLPGRRPALAWQAPEAGPPHPRTPPRPPSGHPEHSFNAGPLALARGVAVIARAAWLHIMGLAGVQAHPAR